MSVPNSKLLNVIDSLKEEDPFRLALQLKGYSRSDLREISQAVHAKHKIKQKLPKWYSIPEIYVPDATIAEQASSQEAAEEKLKWIAPHYDYFVDLTGGLGVDAVALSSVADFCVFVEPNLNRFDAFQHNVKYLSDCSFKLFNCTAEQYLDTLITDKSFCGKRICFFLDPDRRSIGLKNEKRDNRVINPLDSSPNLEYVIEQIKRCSCGQFTVLVKLSPMLDLSYLANLFSEFTSIIAVAVENELKELCLLIESSQSSAENKTLNAVHIQGENRYVYKKYFTKEFSPILSTPEVNKYLYLPNPAMVKIGLENTIFSEKLHKPAPSTFLFFSESLFDFPGRVFKVIEEFNFSKITLKSLKRQNLSVICKNFDLSAEQLRIRLGLKESDTSYIVAYKDCNNMRRMVLVEKIVF